MDEATIMHLFQSVNHLYANLNWSFNAEAIILWFFKQSFQTWSIKLHDDVANAKTGLTLFYHFADASALTSTQNFEGVNFLLEFYSISVRDLTLD